MELMNTFSVKTGLDYKNVQIKLGDISESEDKNILISTFVDGYAPSKGSIVESFFKKGIDLKKLFENPEFDLKKSFNIWSSLIENDKRLIVIEISNVFDKSSESNLELAFENIYYFLLLLEAKFGSLKSISLPLLGTGNQGYDFKKVIPKLINLSKKSLENISSLESITFFTNDKDTAKKIDEELNKFLGRNQMEIQSIFEGETEILRGLTDELSLNLKDFFKKYKCSSSGELIKKIKNKSLRNFELAILSRRILETILTNYTKEKKYKSSLADEIKKLISDKNIPSWIISYMNTIRFFGNSAAHSGDPHFDFLTEKDLIIFLFSLNRIIEFSQSINNHKH